MADVQYSDDSFPFVVRTPIGSSDGRLTFCDPDEPIVIYRECSCGHRVELREGEPGITYDDERLCEHMRSKPPPRRGCAT